VSQKKAMKKIFLSLATVLLSLAAVAQSPGLGGSVGTNEPASKKIKTTTDVTGTETTKVKAKKGTIKIRISGNSIPPAGGSPTLVYDFSARRWGSLPPLQKGGFLQVRVTHFNSFLYAAAVNNSDSSTAKPSITLPSFSGFSQLTDLTGLLSTVAPLGPKSGGAGAITSSYDEVVKSYNLTSPLNEALLNIKGTFRNAYNNAKNFWLNQTPKKQPQVDSQKVVTAIKTVATSNANSAKLDALYLKYAALQAAGYVINHELTLEMRSLSSLYDHLAVEIFGNSLLTKPGEFVVDKLVSVNTCKADLENFEAIQNSVAFAEDKYNQLQMALDSANFELAKYGASLPRPAKAAGGHNPDSKTVAANQLVVKDSAVTKLYSQLSAVINGALAQNLAAAKANVAPVALSTYLTTVATLFNSRDSVWLSQPIQIKNDVNALSLAFTPKSLTLQPPSAGTATDSSSAKVSSGSGKGKGKSGGTSKPATVSPQTAPVVSTNGLESYSVNYQISGVAPRWKFSVSAGFFGCGIQTTGYSSQYQSSTSTTTGSTTTTVYNYNLIKEAPSRMQLGIDALAHLQRERSLTPGAFEWSPQVAFGPGASIGTDKVRPRMLFGGGVSIGNQNKFIITAGIAVGNTPVLSKAYSLGATYTTTSATPASPTVDKLAHGFFLSIGYAFLK
jgi:hypothetical protein